MNFGQQQKFGQRLENCKVKIVSGKKMPISRAKESRIKRSSSVRQKFFENQLKNQMNYKVNEIAVA